MNGAKGLGKGLGALLGDAVSGQTADSLSLPISQIETYAAQPRKRFDEASLADLAESIREHGIIQPLTVRRLASGYYQIVAGERRWRAARMAGLLEVPAIVIDADDRKAMELAMIENLQREDLNPIEEAEGFRLLVERYDMTQEEAASRVGKSRSAVANSMRLLSLCDEVKQLVADGSLSSGHARALLPLSREMQKKAAQTILQSALSVRQTELMVKRLQQEKREKKPAAGVTVNYVEEAQRNLASRLGRGCRIVAGRKKGRVELEFYGMEDLNNLLDALATLRAENGGAGK
ncbi:MAG: ParB/RepB/Spo0J family partition protein [Oscillospiraceae bacterium]|nr:ParB/RepB/Spo0J family partition protein [Oscillospiraceae bacterium]